MSTLSFSAGSSPMRIGRGRWSGVVRGLVQRVGAEWRARRAARSVEALSDEMLHDIGISRGEIDRAVRCGRVRP